jgi:hypothetical protein
MNISKPVNIVNIINGKIPKIPDIIINVAKTFKTTCPAVMFAARRIERLIGRAKYANISITIMSGAKNIGVPFGSRIPRYPIPFFTNPTMVISINTLMANVNVIEMCVVDVKTPGIIPSALLDKIKINIVNTNTKNFFEFFPAVEYSKSLII